MTRVNASQRALAALGGIAAAALGLGVSEAIAGILPGATSLIDAVGQVVIDLQPPGAKDVVVQLFGTNDKLALEIVVTVAAVALGALFGILAARRFAVGALGFGAFGLVGFAAGIGQVLAMPTMVAIQSAVATGVGHPDAVVAAREARRVGKRGRRSAGDLGPGPALVPAADRRDRGSGRSPQARSRPLRGSNSGREAPTPSVPLPPPRRSSHR